MRRLILSFVFLVTLGLSLSAQHNHDHDHGDHTGHNHADHAGHNHAAHADHGHGTEAHADGHDDDGHHSKIICGEVVNHEFDAGKNAIHHIGDANVYSIGPFQIPLPCIVYVPGEGFDFFSSGNFAPDTHGEGKYAYHGFVLDGGALRRVQDGSFPREKVEVAGLIHSSFTPMEKDKDGKEVAGKAKPMTKVCYDEKWYNCDHQSTADFGMFGGGITSFYDFSITKNVVSMFLMILFLSWLFLKMARFYKNNEGQAPSGVTNFMEPLVMFIRDEVAVPFLGHKSDRYLPYLLAIFFFILALNLFGQIPFFGGANVTGNLAVTAVLAIITFLITNVSGNGHYWQHLFIAPGTPWFVKIILIPVEILGMFIKPLTLMLRLFANITAGHMVILIFVSFIFMFGESGKNMVGAWGGVVGSTVLTLFMMAIELIVAFVQAFVFTILTASYIGAATEEAHH